MIKILICGLPGSGKTTLAKPLAESLNAVWLNADAVRNEYKDWDFSKEGRMRQADRMKYLSDVVVEAGQIVVADFICPTEETRKEFNADFTIWMDTIQTGRFDDTNAMFESPTKCDFIVTKWDNDTHIVLKDIIKNL
jgi:adenylylsulfate kinase